MEFKKGTLLYRVMLSDASTDATATIYKTVKKEENHSWYIVPLYKGSNGVERKGHKEIFHPTELDTVYRATPGEGEGYLFCTSLTVRDALRKVLEAAIMQCEQEAAKQKGRQEELKKRLDKRILDNRWGEECL